MDEEADLILQTESVISVRQSDLLSSVPESYPEPNSNPNARLLFSGDLFNLNQVDIMHELFNQSNSSLLSASIDETELCMLRNMVLNPFTES